ncbi:A/G-specific adenine glycosylase [Tenacibaculum maritimum]|uniref:A/G-specific adenine glycosylase n=1 Tax=Tenacibaculum maritimum TaxID=107401 RepID=UPI00040B0471|nr:A/G-specific adenine glycosylase [Tenacibaculum maritimum]
MIFSNVLINWYLQNKRDLPWRKTTSPYHIWLSEIMLQQTKVTQGLPYFMSFTEAFPTVFDLANAAEETVLKLWQGLGYYSRARNLHFTAKYIANELAGNFPDNYKELLKLKGIGDYTASAIASICFNEPTAVVDGNVYRVLSRYFGIKTPINSSIGIKEFKRLAQELIDVKNPAIYNQAIMDFGALHCKPQNPLCETCPFAEGCIALSKKMIKELPVKEKKMKVKKRYFNYIVLVNNNHTTLLKKREGKGIWEGLYEFPLIESSKYINDSELKETLEFQKLFPDETTVTLFNTKRIVHKLSHQHLHTRFWIVETHKVIPSSIFWTAIEEYPVPILIANFLKEFLFEKK